MAEEIRRELRAMRGGKRVFVIGEPFILYDDFLNDFSFRDIENKGHRVIYSPFSKYAWLMWRDFIDQNKKTPILQERLIEQPEWARRCYHRGFYV